MLKSKSVYKYECEKCGWNDFSEDARVDLNCPKCPPSEPVKKDMGRVECAGYMRGNHTFKIFDTIDHAIEESKSGSLYTDSGYEMAFVKYSRGDSLGLHRNPGERQDEFISRAIPYFEQEKLRV
jgi:hypothetical protein